MARMIPDVAPELSGCKSPAEIAVWAALQKMDESFTIFHSLRPSFLDRQCDFVVVHPEYPLFFIEVKGGHVEVGNPHNDLKWNGQRRDGTHFELDNPYAQARSFGSSFVKKWNEASDHKVGFVTYEHLVILPSTPRNSDVDTFLKGEASRFFYAEDMENLGARLLSGYEAFKKPKTQVLGKTAQTHFISDFDQPGVLSGPLGQAPTGQLGPSASPPIQPAAPARHDQEPPQAPPQTVIVQVHKGGCFGTAFGVLGILSGLAAIPFAGVIFVPLSVLFSILAIVARAVGLGVVGLICAGIGTVASPVFLGSMVALFAFGNGSGSGNWLEKKFDEVSAPIIREERTLQQRPASPSPQTYSPPVRSQIAPPLPQDKVPTVLPVRLPDMYVIGRDQTLGLQIFAYAFNPNWCASLGQDDGAQIGAMASNSDLAVKRKKAVFDTMVQLVQLECGSVPKGVRLKLFVVPEDMIDGKRQHLADLALMKTVR